MRIQNAPLDRKQLDRIQTFIVEMNNKTACKAETLIDTRTIDTILKREWGAVAHIQKLLDYCDMVEQFSKTIHTT